MCRGCGKSVGKHRKNGRFRGRFHDGSGRFHVPNYSKTDGSTTVPGRFLWENYIFTTFQCLCARRVGNHSKTDSSTTVPRRFRTVPQTVPGRPHVGKLHICHICARMRASACKCAPKTRQTGRFRDGSIQFHAIKRNT